MCVGLESIRLACVPHTRLPIGTSGGYRSIGMYWHNLACSSRTYMYCNSMRVYTLRWSSSTVGLPGKSGDFMVFRCVLTYSIASPVVSVLFLVPGMSCALSTCAVTFQGHLVQVPPQPASPEFNFVPVPSPSLPQTVSQVLNTVRASAWPLGPFTWLFDLFTQLL